MEIDPSLVVLGDVLRVQPGDQVVVDGPMVGEGRMEVDESLLTGESDLVTKHPGDELMSGSFCMTGGGYYEAAQVGLDSFANKITAKAKAFKRELTPLQRQVLQIVRVLLIVVIVFEILVWVRNMAGGVPFVESVRMSTVILALIPNGLVLSIALTYALGAVRLLGKDMLVQQFNAVESLSNVDVLCTDKTGTLTSGVIAFEELGPLGADESRAARLLGAFAASTTDANRTIEALRAAFPAARETAAHEAFFSSDRKWSGLAFAEGEERGTYVLGAPEILAPALRAGDGDVWRARADEWTARGLRVVLFAGRAEPLAFGEPDGPPSLPARPRGARRHLLQRRVARGVRQTLQEFSERRHRREDHLRRQPAAPWSPSRRRRACRRFAATRASTPTATCCTRVRRRRTGAAPAASTAAGATREALPAAAADDPPRRAADRAHWSPCPGRSWRAVTGGARRRRRRRQRVRPRHARAEAGPGGCPARQRPLRGHDRRRRQRRHRPQQANVAVAMQGGSQAARSVGDLILMKDTFAPLPFAFREGQRIINGMNDILRIFMVRIFFKAAMIAIVTAIGGFPFAPRQSALLSFFGATVPAVAFALWAEPGPTPKVGLFKLLARFVLPTTALMTAMATGIYLAWAIPAKNSYLALHPGAGDKELIANAYPPAMTALTLFACFAAIFLILLIVPPSRWWSGGAAVVRGDQRIVGVVVFLFVCMVAVLAVPLGRTLFELTALPVWQYFVLLGLAFVWSQLCRLVWHLRLLDRWLGTAEDPGNLCAKAAARVRPA